MSIKTRIAKAEKVSRPRRTALFTISNGRASGRAWWRDALTWENLSKPEFDQLAADLEAEGVQVVNVNVKSIKPGGEIISSWEVKNHDEKTN